MTERPPDNRSQLVRAVARGRVAPPRLHAEGLRHDREGRVVVWPGTGGVHPGVHVGDRVDAWLADHLMVGISVEDAGAAPAEPGPLHLLACVGNRVRDAAGVHLGVIAGKRGGLAPGFFPPHLLAVEAPEERLRRVVPGDVVFVETVGRGLALEGRPEALPLNCSPEVLDALPLRVAGSTIEVEVRLVVPSRAAGAGLGQDAWIGDLEIADPRAVAGVDDLRFGDLVAFADIDGRFGRYYRPGMVSIGIVAHGPSPAPGHGVGVTLLLAGPSSEVWVRQSPDATIAPLLQHLAQEGYGAIDPQAQAPS